MPLYYRLRFKNNANTFISNMCEHSLETELRDYSVLLVYNTFIKLGAIPLLHQTLQLFPEDGVSSERGCLCTVDDFQCTRGCCLTLECFLVCTA